VTEHTRAINGMRREHGFSMIELLVSIAVLMIISATVTEGVLRLTRTNQTVANRSEMHASVRNVTALLQQEIGQAGRITLPAGVTIVGTIDSSNYTASSTLGMFVGEQLVIDTGNSEETVQLTAINNNTITGSFFNPHNAGAPISVYGGFAQGVVPPSAANGSTGSILKIFGDINGTGNMVYVQYECDVNAGRLYRRSMAFNIGAKTPLTPDQTLLNNVVANPIDPATGLPADCFTYQEAIANGDKYVVDVAITLTVQTPAPDPVTGLYQKETKALLNVSPRNVFNVWELAGLGVANRVQPTPPSVTNLLP
jgi:prepilin-type N-terminal cleavage/methylation domain-containing protein